MAASGSLLHTIAAEGVQPVASQIYLGSLNCCCRVDIDSVLPPWVSMDLSIVQIVALLLQAQQDALKLGVEKVL